MSDCIRLKELHAHLALDLRLDQGKYRIVERLRDPAQGGEKQWVGGQKLAPGSSKQPKTYLTRPSGIMVISESHTRGSESECEQGAEALAEAVAEAAHRPSADGPHSPKLHFGGGGTDEYRAEECLESAHASPHDRMVSAHKHEAALGNLVDAAVQRGEVRQRRGGMDEGQSSLTPSPTNFLPYTRETVKRKWTGQKVPTIYKIVSPSGAGYVGQTVDFVKRMWGHKNSPWKARSSHLPLAKAIRKYGWERMKVVVLRGGVENVGGAVASEELDDLEAALIAQHDCLSPNGYNVHPGGQNRFGRPVGSAMVQAIQDGWNKPGVREKASQVHKKRCREDDGRQGRQGALNLIAGGATAASLTVGAMEKRAGTWEAKREAKLQDMPVEEAERIRKKALFNKQSYKRQCELAGGVEELRAKRREWARIRKAKKNTFLANS